MLHLYATKIYFTYICKLSCILCNASIDHDRSICSTYQCSAAEPWHKPILFSHILDWFDLVHHKFDHQSSLRKLNLILNNMTIYLFVFHHDHDSWYFTYTYNLSCLMYSRHIFHVNKNHTTCSVYIYYVYTLFFLFLSLSSYESRGRLFLKKGRMMRIQSWIMLILSV
jgi:hypothetical protein